MKERYTSNVLIIYPKYLGRRGNTVSHPPLNSPGPSPFRPMRSRSHLIQQSPQSGGLAMDAALVATDAPPGKTTAATVIAASVEPAGASVETVVPTGKSTTTAAIAAHERFVENMGEPPARVDYRCRKRKLHTVTVTIPSSLISPEYVRSPVGKSHMATEVI
jgi:hypothetical protein